MKEGTLMLIYQYYGGMDGFLSAVFRAYQDRTVPDLITDGDLREPPLDSKIVHILPDEAKALRVEQGIHNRMGPVGLQRISYAYASAAPEKNRVLFLWILSVFKYGAYVTDRYQDPNVLAFNDLTEKVSREIERMLGFLRFEESPEGLFYAEFAPDNNVLPFLMPHFVRRMNDQNFLIRDRKRNLYGVYNGEEWKVIASETSLPLRPSETEKQFQSLWREYYRSVNIAARENRRLQDSYLPRRYRVFLTEFRTQP